MSPHGFIYSVYWFVQVLGSTDFILRPLRSQSPSRFGPPLGHQAFAPGELLNWPAELLPLNALNGPPDLLSIGPPVLAHSKWTTNWTASWTTRLAPDWPTRFGPPQMAYQGPPA